MNALDTLNTAHTALLGMSDALRRVVRSEDVLDQAHVAIWSVIFGPPGGADHVDTSLGGLLDRVDIRVGNVPASEGYARARTAILAGKQEAAFLENIGGDLYLSRYAALRTPAGALKGLTCTTIFFGDAEWATARSECPFSREPCGRISAKR